MRLHSYKNPGEIKEEYIATGPGFLLQLWRESTTGAQAKPEMPVPHFTLDQGRFPFQIAQDIQAHRACGPFAFYEQSSILSYRYQVNFFIGLPPTADP